MKKWIISDSNQFKINFKGFFITGIFMLIGMLASLSDVFADTSDILATILLSIISAFALIPLLNLFFKLITKQVHLKEIIINEKDRVVKIQIENKGKNSLVEVDLDSVFFEIGKNKLDGSTYHYFAIGSYYLGTRNQPVYNEIVRKNFQNKQDDLSKKILEISNYLITLDALEKK